MNVYKCSKCESEFFSPNNLNYCLYCNNNVLKSEIDDEFNDISLIPFEITKDKVFYIIKEFYNNKKLTYKNFSKYKYVSKIKKIYLPCYIYDVDCTGEVEFSCQKVNTWKNEENEYKKTDEYKVIRSANMSLENVSIIGCENIENNVLELIEPFDYKKLEKFNSSYFEECILLKNKLDEKDLIKKSNEKSKIIFIDELKKNIIGYNNIEKKEDSINLNNFKYKIVLLPIWLLNIKQKNNIYTFAINGQTGKIMSTIKQNKKRIISVWLITFIIIFAILFLLNLFRVIL